MRILVNAASAHMGGAVTYLRNVLRWLPEVAPDVRAVVYAPAATRDQLAPDVAPTIEVRAYPFASTKGVPRLYFDQVEVARLALRERVDVVFSSTGFGTLVSPRPQVLLVRNMAYFDPAFHRRYRRLGRSLRRNTLRRHLSLLSIRAADAVLFPTRAMQRMVERYARLERKPTAALHYGFDHEAFARRSGTEGEAAAAVRQMKQRGEVVLLSVSTYAVHKNFETLIEALPQVRAADARVRLVTTTSRERTSDRAEYDALQRRAEALGVRAAWHELGYVPYAELGGLYALADAYVFPSFTESFGHSMVEAMASGLPVVAAGTAVNREVLGEAGTYFGTFDAGACARAVLSVTGSAERRAELSARSRRRAEAFCWRGYTEALVDVFRRTAGNGGVRRPWHSRDHHTPAGLAR